MKSKLFPFIYIFCILVIFLSCSNKPKRERKPVSTITLSPNQKNYTFGEQVDIQVKTRLRDGEIEKIELYHENNLLATEKSLDFTYRLKAISKLGPNLLKVVATKTDKLENTRYKTFSALSDITPEVNQFELVNEYPHSTEYFTQGLEVNNGFLYESTGQEGTSAIHKITFQTGNVISKVNLYKQYFGEGITILGNNIYQLTYKSKKGFVYNLSDFTLTDSFRITSVEGWGLTNDGKHLIMSDGTDRLTWINPENYSVIKSLYVATDKMHIKGLNELEFVNGSIFANVWTENYIIKINPENGKVISITDLSELYSHFIAETPIDVLNGIAYIESSGNFLVTGKFWPILFEIKLLSE